MDSLSASRNASPAASCSAKSAGVIDPKDLNGIVYVPATATPLPPERPCSHPPPNVLAPIHTALLQDAIDDHPLHRELAVTFLDACLRSKFVPVAMQKDVAHVLVHLMTTGLLHPVLACLDAATERGLDRAVVCHFVEQLAKAASPPYSRPFLQGVAGLVAKPAVLDALKRAAEKKRVSRFCGELLGEGEGVLGEAAVRALELIAG